MTIYVGRKTLEIVTDDENLNELVSIRQSTSDVPGQRDSNSDQQAFGMPGLPLIPGAADRRKAKQRNRREQKCDWPFCERAQSQRKIKQVKPLAALRSFLIHADQKEHQSRRETCR